MKKEAKSKKTLCEKHNKLEKSRTFHQEESYSTCPVVIGGKKEENFLLEAALLHVWNYSEFQYALAISRTWVCWGVVFNDFKTVWFSFLVRLLMIRTLMQHFQTVSSAYPYSKKPAPKCNRFLNMLWLTLKWTLGSTGLRLIVDVLLLHQSGVNCRPQPATLLKKRLWDRCFPVNFAKFLRTPFL